MNFLSRTATGGIHMGADAYFDNDIILSHFERFLKMLEFKQECKNNMTEIIVDNARIYTKKTYSLLEFDKNIGTRCRGQEIEYADEGGAKKVIYCYLKQEQNKDKSNGLIEICKEFGSANIT